MYVNGQLRILASLCTGHSYVRWEAGLLSGPDWALRKEKVYCNKEFCVLHVQSNTTIFYSSTVGIQLHVSALYVGHIQVVMLLTEQL